MTQCHPRIIRMTARSFDEARRNSRVAELREAAAALEVHQPHVALCEKVHATPEEEDVCEKLRLVERLESLAEWLRERARKLEAS